MDASAAPEPPNESGFADLLARLDEGPVTMLNLLAFQPDGGRERYLEHGDAVAPLLEKAGRGLVFQGPQHPVEDDQLRPPLQRQPFPSLAVGRGAHVEAPLRTPAQGSRRSPARPPQTRISIPAMPAAACDPAPGYGDPDRLDHRDRKDPDRRRLLRTR